MSYLLYSLAHQGRNISGKVGLFPQTYTSTSPPSAEALALAPSPSSNSASGSTSALLPAAPEPIPVEQTASSKTILQPLHEESESESPPPVAVNGDDRKASMDGSIHSAGDGEVMKATMTDVQKAIEQLGRRREHPDESRSFSFTSSRDDRDTDNDTDLDFDLDDPSDNDGGGENWHKGARKKLAEKARRAVEEAEKLEMIMGAGRSKAPPIEVELSDESEGEDDPEEHEHTHTSYARQHPHIPEEEEEVDEFGTLKGSTEGRESTLTKTINTNVDAPARDESEVQTATAPRFPSIRPPTPHLSSVEEPNQISPVSASQPEPVALNDPPVAVALSSPTPSSTKLPSLSKHSSIASSTKASSLSPSVPQPLSAFSQQATLVEEKPSKEKGHPTEWSVDDVVEWLKSKGFDQEVCDKFIGESTFGSSWRAFIDQTHRTRNYWRRSARTRRESSKIRDRHHGIRETYAYRQCYHRSSSSSFHNLLRPSSITVFTLKSHVSSAITTPISIKCTFSPPIWNSLLWLYTIRSKLRSSVP